MGPKIMSPQFLNFGIMISNADTISVIFTNAMKPLCPVALKKGITNESAGGAGMEKN